MSARLASNGTADFAALGVVPQLVRALQAMRVEAPTRSQRAAIPPALAGRDLAVVAPTGTGKTLAYLVPVAQKLLEQPPPRMRGRPIDPQRRLRSLVLCPTRELAQQVAREAQLLFRGSVLRAAAVFGKSALAPQRLVVRRGVDLLVGTPGRVKELCEEDSISLAFVRFAVIDEADRMLDMGFLPQATGLLSRAGSDRQLLLYSATMPRMVERAVQEMLRDPERVDLSHGAPARVTGTPNPRKDAGHHLMDVEDDAKAAVTVALVKDGHRNGVIVFCRTRRRAGWVAAALRRHQISTALLHGDRSQRQRQAALDEFAKGHARVLVATDVASRGLHVEAVRSVINYDVPLMPEDYVHRAGRAGHGGGFAEAITLRSPADVVRWKRVEREAKIEVKPEGAPGHAQYMRGFQAAQPAPDTERAPHVPGAKQRGGGGARGGATRQQDTAAEPRRSGGRTGSRKPSRTRRRMQSRAPLGKNQKPGGGVRKG